MPAKETGQVLVHRREQAQPDLDAATAGTRVSVHSMDTAETDGVAMRSSSATSCMSQLYAPAPNRAVCKCTPEVGIACAEAHRHQPCILSCSSDRCSWLTAPRDSPRNRNRNRTHCDASRARCATRPRPWPRPTPPVSTGGAPGADSTGTTNGSRRSPPTPTGRNQGHRAEGQSCFPPSHIGSRPRVRSHLETAVPEGHRESPHDNNSSAARRERRTSRS